LENHYIFIISIWHLLSIGVNKAQKF